MNVHRRHLAPLVRAFLLLVSVAMLVPAVPPPVAAAPTAQGVFHGPVAQPAQAPRTPGRSTGVPTPDITPQNLPARVSIALQQHPAALPLSDLPLSFVLNVGQTDRAVQYMAKSRAGTLFFTPEEIVIGVPNSKPPPRIDPKALLTETTAISISVVRLRYEGAAKTPPYL